MKTLLIHLFTLLFCFLSGLMRAAATAASPVVRCLLLCQRGCSTPLGTVRPPVRRRHLLRGALPYRTGPPRRALVGLLLLSFLTSAAAPLLAQIPISNITGLRTELNRLSNLSRQAMTGRGAKLPVTAYTAPTVTLSAAGAATGIASATTYNAYEPSARTTQPFTTAKPAVIGVSTFFTFTGCKPQQAGGGAPDTVLVKGLQNSSGLDNGHIAVEFYHFGSQLELIQKGQSGKVRINVDGVDIVYATNGVPSTNDTWPTAQAGAATTITLAASSSATNDAYSGWYLEIMAGTGAGQVRQITNYVGSTKVATVAAWDTNPDNTSTYRMSTHRTGGFSAPGASGSMYNILLDWAGVRARRHIRIDISNAYFGGVRTGPTDAVWPAVPEGGPVCIWLGDSLSEGTGAGSRYTSLAGWCAAELGWQVYINGSGGTGYLNPGSNGRMTIPDRVLPPTNAYKYYLGGATGGTFTLSVTTAAGVQTTEAIAYNATIATIKSNLEGLSNVGSGNVDVYGPCAAVYYVLFRNALATAATCTLATDATSITGGSAGARFCNQYLGDVKPYIPTDATGAQLPFYLVFAAGYNDTTSSNAAYTPAALTTAVRALWTGAQARFPTATILVVGSHCPASTIASALSDAEAALVAEAALSLRKVNGYTPFISQHGWFNGTGYVGAETGAGNADYAIYNDAVHMTDIGHQLVGQRLGAEFGLILGIRQQDGSIFVIGLAVLWGYNRRRKRKSLFSMDA